MLTSLTSFSATPGPVKVGILHILDCKERSVPSLSLATVSSKNDWSEMDVSGVLSSKCEVSR